MNENYIFGIGIVLAVLLVFAASAMAGPNTGYFVPQTMTIDPGETAYVEVWVNITDPIGVSEDYTFDACDVNVTFDSTIADITATNRVPGDPWDSYYEKHRYGDSWWFIMGAGNWSQYPYGQGPGLWPVVNFTIMGVSPGTMDLAFSIDLPRRCNMFDALGDQYPNKTWVDGTITCTGTVEPETYTKPLSTGWNLISLPLTNETDMTVANIIDASLSSSYDALYKYDVATHNFVALGGSSDTMENGVGYFIHMTSPDTWTYQGTAYTTMTASLAQGLNCIGWTNETDSALPDALNSIAGNYRYVARWNATSQSYEVYLPGAPDVFNDFATMDRGEGYFIAATAGCSLTYP